MTLSKQRFGAQLYCYSDGAGFSHPAPPGQGFSYVGKASELLPLEINVRQLLTKILWNGALIQRAANLLSNVRTEIVLISRAGLQCGNPHICEFGVRYQQILKQFISSIS